MRTWVWEIALVSLVLIGVVAVTHGGPVEAVGTLAVLATFAHAQVAERMREREALKTKPDVACHRWSTRYFFAKELLWLSYFVAHRSWSALVGVGVFLAYPLWRTWWRKRHPLLKVFVEQPVVTVYINQRQFDLMPGSHVQEGERWCAVLMLRLDREGCEYIAALSRGRASFQAALVPRGQVLLAGDAKPQLLHFFDRTDSPGVRFARFVVIGERELEHVRYGI